MTASARHLLILDVDGTLVQTLDAEALLYPRACERALALSGVSADWGSYRCPSDRGIVRELIEKHRSRKATAADYASVERHFLALIQEAYVRQKELCQPVAGAIEAVSRFRQLPETVLSIASAGWRSTARYKLAFAGFSIEDLPLATSHDAEAKIDIIQIAADRASSGCGVERFESVICFGDSAGDARVAARLGFGFIGIDTSGFVAGAEYRYADFQELDEIVSAVRSLQVSCRRVLGTNFRASSIQG